MGIASGLAEAVRDAARMGPRFCWQGLRRFAGNGPLRIDIPGVGPAFVRRGDSDFATIRQVFRGREYDVGVEPVRRQLAARYEALLRAGRTPVIVDAGANIGAASLWFAHRYPDAHLVAIEPDADTVALLRRNLAGLARMTILPAAIGGSRGRVSLVQEGLSWAVQTERGTGEIPIVTMQDAIDAVPNGALFIAKIDIEGFESDLFSANTEWIDAAELIALEPHDWMMPGRGTSLNFQAELGRRRFEMYLRGENVLYVRMESRAAPG